MIVLELTKEWFKFAHNDLISARHLFEDLYPKQTHIAAYLSQQCAEKALKAFLVSNNRDPPKIHDLEELGELCNNIDNDFSQIKIDCQKINPYGVASRYPDEIDVDEIIAKTLIERARKIYDFCVEKTNAMFQKKDGQTNGCCS